MPEETDTRAWRLQCLMLCVCFTELNIHSRWELNQIQLQYNDTCSDILESTLLIIWSVNAIDGEASETCLKINNYVWNTVILTKYTRIPGKATTHCHLKLGIGCMSSL